MDKDKDKSQMTQEELWRLEEIEEAEFDYRLDLQDYQTAKGEK